MHDFSIIYYNGLTNVDSKIGNKICRLQKLCLQVTLSSKTKKLVDNLICTVGWAEMNISLIKLLLFSLAWYTSLSAHSHDTQFFCVEHKIVDKQIFSEDLKKNENKEEETQQRQLKWLVVKAA